MSGGYNKGSAKDKAHNDMAYAAISAFEHFTFAFSDGGFVIANPMMIDDGRWCQVRNTPSVETPSLKPRTPPSAENFRPSAPCAVRARHNSSPARGFSFRRDVRGGSEIRPPGPFFLGFLGVIWTPLGQGPKWPGEIRPPPRGKILEFLRRPPSALVFPSFPGSPSCTRRRTPP